jgi:uncharacterized Zn finger protein
MKNLTAEQYIEHGAMHCPNCGSLEISAEQARTEYTTAWASVECHECGAMWEDVYTLTTYENLTIPEKENAA